MKIEIVTDRDPDGYTSTYIFIDGEPVEKAEGIELVDITVDPGASGSGKAWQQEMRVQARSLSRRPANIVRTLASGYAGRYGEDND